MEYLSLFENLPEGFRIGREEDRPLMTLTLAQAFADYPYPIPSEVVSVTHSERLRIMYDIFSYIITNALENGAILTNEDFSAVMVTVPADKMCPFPLDEVEKFDTEVANAEVAANVRALFEHVDEMETEHIHLKEGTVYIECLAVQTPKQGKKLGSKLMRELFDLCDKQKRDILLYTNTDRNVSIYKHFGYEVIHRDMAEELQWETHFMLRHANP